MLLLKSISQFFGGDVDIQRWAEIAHPAPDNETRTGEEIISDITTRLNGGGNGI